MHFQLLLEKFENLNRQLLYTNFFDYRCYYTYEYHLFSLKCNKEREINTHYCLELHKTRTMNLILSHFLATGIQQERRDSVDLLEELLGMPSMRDIEALARHPPPQLSGAIQIPASHIQVRWSTTAGVFNVLPTIMTALW